VKARIIALAAAAAIAVASPIAAGAHTASHAVASKTCSASYVLAHLSWGDKCLRAGEFCKVGNREYLRYGFYCPPTGHLRRR
jgi:hypothetical protein